MKRPLKFNIGFKAIFALFILMLFGNVGAKAYCDFYVDYYYYPYDYCMAINIVKFEGVVIQKWDVPRDKGGNIILGVQGNYYLYKDIDPNNGAINVEKDKSYTLECYGGAQSLVSDSKNTIDEYVTIGSYYPLDFKAYIDFNQDNEFDNKAELAGQLDCTGSGFGGKFTITIPKDAKPGKTRMRIVSDYYASNGSWGPGYDACNSAYGEARDFYVTVKAGVDCGISKITSPVTPLTTGIQPVKAMLKNYSTSTLTKCTIKWFIDGKAQTPYNWTGTLAGGSEVEVTLGTFDFVSKGIPTTYTISAITDKPNGEDDGNTANDASPAYNVSIPIGPGIYYVGGTDYDFKTLKDATDLINSTGITGDGNFVLRIRPGTYTGPFIMDNFKHAQNNIIFEPDPADPGAVNITAPTGAANYVWYINNIPDVTFRNLTFSVTNPIGYGGRIFMLRGNIDDYLFESNTFNGLASFQQSWFQYSMIDCQADQMNNHKYLSNTFNDGFMSMVIINPASNSAGLIINDNIFNTFTNRAIQVEGIGDGLISNNLLKASTTPTFSGIVVYNGTDVVKNMISGIIGINNTGAGILVVHNSITAPANINSNKIIECTGINGITATGIAGGTINNNTIELLNSNLTLATGGILLTNNSLNTSKVIMSDNNVTMENGYGLYVVNSTTDILRNRVVVANASSKINLKSISATGSAGMVLLNEVISAGEAMEIDNSNFTVAYNSTLALGTADALTVENGNNKIFRNQLINRGTGKAFMITAGNSAMLDGNNYLSTTGALGEIAGATYTNPTELVPIDNNVRSTDPRYKANDMLRITAFKDELAFYTPLKNVNWPQGYQKAYEETTFDGLNREGTYYVGAYNIFPVVTILAYTKELIDCSDTEKDMSLTVASTTTEGEEPNLQWFKDGVLLPGKTSHTLHIVPFDYTASGVYTCQAIVPGAKLKTTPGIPVYAITIPSIVEQPKEVINAVLGNDYTFNLRVHYRGLIPPFYKDYFQWYKYDALLHDSIPLKDDGRFAGTESSELNIGNLQPEDICKPGDFYFVKVEGQCGIVYSDPFVISETPEVVFRDQPENLTPCPGTDVVFTANAIPPQGYNLSYKWMKDGVDLTNDVKYNGVNTNKLQIFAVQAADQGNYVCEASIPEVPTSKNSNAGKLTLKVIPEGIADGETNITTKRGNDITMVVKLIKGDEPITIKWYYKDELLKEGIWDQFNGDKLLTLLLEGVNENQGGEYKCILENECNFTEVLFKLTVTKWDETNSVEVISQNGYTLYTCMPNPTNGTTKIRFEMPETDNAVITLVDQTGRKLSVLFDGVANKGMNVLDVNTSSLNVASGVYFYMITANGFNAALPMVIIK